MFAGFEKITEFPKSKYEFRLNQEIFALAWGDEGVRVYKTPATEKGIRALADDLGKVPSAVRWELKIIGPDAMLKRLEASLHENGHVVAKAVPREGSFEVVYSSSDRKILLAKDAKPVAPVAAKTPAPASKVVEEKRSGPIKVMIVDDSPTIIHLLTKIFETDKEIKVVATCEDPRKAEELIKSSKPDVITMDIHMPHIDGVALVKKVFPVYRLPIVMISSISQEEGPQVFNALENGAVDYIQKPTLKDLDQVAPMIIERIKIASQAELSSKYESKAPVKRVSGSQAMNQSSLIVIGSSTGGTEALRKVLERMPAQIPPTLIVQHIPAVFSAAFAKRLNDICPFNVKEAEEGDVIEPNWVYVAPGGKQMGVIKRGGKYQLNITDDAPVNRHKPSVDYMFKTVCDLQIPDVVGVILTGMGADGARELLRLRQSGARTIAQNKETSVVYGMPREAVERGAAEFVLPLGDIPEKLVELCSPSAKKSVKAGRKAG